MKIKPKTVKKMNKKALNRENSHTKVEEKKIIDIIIKVKEEKLCRSKELQT